MYIPEKQSVQREDVPKPMRACQDHEKRSFDTHSPPQENHSEKFISKSEIKFIKEEQQLPPTQSLKHSNTHKSKLNRI